MDVSMLSMDQLLEEFNGAVPKIGREVSFFIADQEMEPTLLQPGQPYSVYPKTFKRSEETSATVSGPIRPRRLEGPKVNIQWVALDTERKQLSLPNSDKVPAEVTLLQMWKMESARSWHNLRSRSCGDITTEEE
jgi:hypothetical protein